MTQARFTFATVVTRLLTLAVVGLPVAVVGQTYTNQDQSARTELIEQGYPIKTGLRAVPASKAALRDSDLVIGIVIGKVARAYPLNPMWGRSTRSSMTLLQASR